MHVEISSCDAGIVIVSCDKGCGKILTLLSKSSTPLLL